MTCHCRQRVEQWVISLWYSNKFRWLILFLLPLSSIFYCVVMLRRWLYQHKFISSKKPPVSVIVVGNITVGGTGKTPLVIHLVEQLKQSGKKLGVISRGYGVNAIQPILVDSKSSSKHVGDEALLIAQRTQAPVVICQDRVKAAEYLLEHVQCDIIISDDGLQHYRLARDIEIAVIDGERELGNGFMLPAGPLREPKSRLTTVNHVFVKTNEQASNKKFNIPNQHVSTFTLQPNKLYVLNNPSNELELSTLSGKRVHAVTGIGNPDSFFQTLRKLGAEVIEHRFPDHHIFSKHDIPSDNEAWIVMTEKDAVKCHDFAMDNIFVLGVGVVSEDVFLEVLGPL